MATDSVRKALYQFLEEEYPRTTAKVLFRGFMYFLISLNILLVILESIPRSSAEFIRLYSIAYGLSIVVFIALYILRLWVCTENPRWSRPVSGRLAYLATPYALLDLSVIVTFIIPIPFLGNPEIYELLKFLRLAVILGLVRYSESLQTLLRIFYSRRKPLGMAVYMLFFILVISSILMYYFESQVQPDTFSDIPASMWWSVETLTTVGYGDIVPVTPGGKILGGFVALLGIAMIAIPAGILASGFSEEYSLRSRRDGKKPDGYEESPDFQPSCPVCGRPLETGSEEHPKP